MQLTHKDAEQRYSEFRAIALQSIQKNLPYPDKARIRLKLIDTAALSASKLWESDRTRQVDWSWFNSYPGYRYSYPKRFELALWYDNTLSSLSTGRPSYHGGRLRLEFIEARPTDHPLKGRVTPIVLSAAEVYAGIIGATQLRIIDPIDMKLIDYYSSFGYSLRTGEKTPYMVKDLL